MTTGKVKMFAWGPPARRPISARHARVVPDYVKERTSEYPANGSSFVAQGTLACAQELMVKPHG